MNRTVYVRGLSAALPFGGSPQEDLQVLRHARDHSATAKLRLDDAELSSWIQEFAIPPKQKKFFDRASALLFRSVEPLRPLLAEESLDETGFYIAVGPNRAELAFFLDWAERDREQAEDLHGSLGATDVVKLLPNVSVTNLAVPLGLRGENGVYAGYATAAGAALEAAVDGLRSGRFSTVLVAAASSPLNYFNQDSRRRHFAADCFPRPLAEGAGAVLLSTLPGADGQPRQILERLSVDPPESGDPEMSSLPWDFLTAAPLLEWACHGDRAGVIRVPDALGTVTLELGMRHGA